MVQVDNTTSSDFTRSNNILNIAKSYTETGLSVIPIKTDGSKSPSINKWEPYKNKIASEEELRYWYGHGQETGIAIVCGSVSNNLLVLDFECLEVFEDWYRLAKSYGLEQVLNSLPTAKTPSGGKHLFLYCASGAPAGKKLALDELEVEKRKYKTNKKDRLLIETRGEGNYVVASGSPLTVHEEHQPYTWEKLDHKSIPVIDDGSLDALLSIAASFNSTFINSYTPKVEASANGVRPGDDFNIRADWRNDVLLPAGCKEIGGRDNESFWIKPGSKSKVMHAKLNYQGNNKLHVFSTSFLNLAAGHSYDKFQVYTFLFHNGDFAAAANALTAKGYGKHINGSLERLTQGEFASPNDDWPEPKEIVDKLLPVEQLDLELIPQPFRDWISDEAYRMPCPIDFVAAAAIVITASVIGAGCGVRPKASDDWTEYGNLWGSIIGTPGKLKSPAIKKPLKLLSKLETKAQIEYERATKEHQVNSQEYKFTKKKYEEELEAIINPIKSLKVKKTGGKEHDNKDS